MSDENNGRSDNQGEEKAASNKPVDVLRDGALKAAIFKNDREGKSYFSIDAGRIYTDQSGQVKESKSINDHEALRMSRLIEKSYDRIGEMKSALKEQSKAAERDR